MKVAVDPCRDMMRLQQTYIPFALEVSRTSQEWGAPIEISAIYGE
jgi:hypothetical protein